MEVEKARPLTQLILSTAVAPTTADSDDDFARLLALGVLGSLALFL
jgi:hypothetical protein